MKTYDEVYDNIIAATNAHKQKMRKIQNAVSVSALCLTCIFGVGMFLKLERPLSRPSVPEETTTMTTSEMTDMVDTTASAPASSDTAEPSTTISRLIENEEEPPQTSAPAEQEFPGTATSTAGHDDKIPAAVPSAEIPHSETTAFPEGTESSTYASESTASASSSKATEKATTSVTSTAVTSSTKATTKETSATTKETTTAPKETTGIVTTSTTAATEQTEPETVAPTETLPVEATTPTDPVFTESPTEEETDPLWEPEEPTEAAETPTESPTEAPTVIEPSTEPETTTTAETTTTTTETTTSTTETTTTTTSGFWFLIEYNGVYYTPERWEALFGNLELPFISPDILIPENSESSVTITISPEESGNS